MTWRPFALSFAVVSTALLAQQPPSPLPLLVEKVNVSVINVDASVLDAGKPVTGLTADDFELFEDGKPQRITNFYSVIGGAVHEDATTAAAPIPVKRFRRKAVLLVDNHFIDKHSRDAALRQLRTFIDSDYAGDYDWSIGTISSGVHVIQPFTSDKAVINAAIDRLLRGSAGLQTAPLDQGALTQSAQGVGATAAAQAAFAQDATDRIAMEANIRFSSTLDALRASARAVIDACRAYTSIEGKKLIVLVTGSMEIDNRGASSNDVDRFANTPADNDREAATIREAMVREANAANFNIYIVKASGVTTPVAGFDVSEGRPDDRVLGEVRNNDALAVALSSETGGAYLTSNVVGQSIRTIDTTSGSFYSLGYSPKHFEDGKYHTISVRVKSHAYVVRSRSGYLDTSSDTRFEDSLKVAASAAVVEGTLPVSVAALQKSPKDRVFYIPVTTSLPMSAITTLRRGDHTVGRVHVYLSVFDQNGENVAFNHAVQQIDLTDAQLKQIASTPEMKFRYTMKVDLNPGLYRVVVAVRDELSDEVGKATTVIDTRS
jgi:VWFA-related protein